MVPRCTTLQDSHIRAAAIRASTSVAALRASEADPRLEPDLTNRLVGSRLEEVLVDRLRRQGLAQKVVHDLPLVGGRVSIPDRQDTHDVAVDVVDRGDLLEVEEIED